MYYPIECEPTLQPGRGRIRGTNYPIAEHYSLGAIMVIDITMTWNSGFVFQHIFLPGQYLWLRKTEKNLTICHRELVVGGNLCALVVLGMRMRNGIAGIRQDMLDIHEDMGVDNSLQVVFNDDPKKTISVEKTNIYGEMANSLGFGRLAELFSNGEVPKKLVGLPVSKANCTTKSRYSIIEWVDKDTWLQV
ncbi:hypothetical protein BDZ94DRAFT_1238378 [Collybia nuda]|uniref:Uncharacterized protein n=1 Tax=Collybia nuda TaxID=64659 RepID=A0A9P6CCE0_9AGAR|nr:hypothetical protein BDZ94DRAFT_1238378 [Collybia nuda]